MPTLKEIHAWQKKTRRKLDFTPYTLDRVKERDSTYSMIIGERSNGKTYSALEEGLIQWALNKKQIAYVRRYDLDLKTRRAQQVFAAFHANGFINFITDGEFDSTYYYSGKWYFSRTDENGKRVKSDEPFAYAFTLVGWEHDKSTSYPGVTTIIFDEFLSRDYYLDNEFVIFMNLVSTIVRQRNDVKIYMLGNTVNRYCPYFSEMGLTHVSEMIPGDIDVYRYGDSDLTVCVEMTHPTTGGKSSDHYFAFDNPKLQMITGGAWEIDIYPHLKKHYRPADVVFRFYIMFDNHSLRCDVVCDEQGVYIYIVPKNDDIKDPDNDLVFSPEVDPRPNWRRRLSKPTLPVEKNIYSLFKQEKVFYATNEVGEIVRNYLMWCNT